MEAKVSDRVVWGDSGCVFNWEWSRDPMGRTKSELDDLITLISSYTHSSEASDSWRWSFSSNGKFTTKQLNSIIMDKTLAGDRSLPETKRNMLIPKKIEIFIWRACKKRLPSLMELDKRGVDLHTVRCPMCDDDVESIDHALIFCKNAFEVWTIVYKWWGLGCFSKTSIVEAFDGSVAQGCSETGGLIWQAVEWSCGYLLWKSRNLKIFKSKVCCVPSIVNEIHILSFDWISRRLKHPKIDWCTWLSNPNSYLAIT
ncbi:uncharacterized protein [Rutidosis leptorrhynchoides]|uniref:uncharacterized protein n=1 Tax=Rutidosis leptorrhynchoides TaxID=125765 RepID=UPI003A9A02FB